ncbi:hypothetical protein GCM10010168_26740 [Actinoplanes ianthinogenes]|uniref:Uncharacterized protein n=1 Tax=Actinoplanes ianthinogenes TaxID=122358 RepID=A0ABN6C5F0_9ACTN|nr:hypothetical protein [Actinoplanes ianthinogenes]BCJ39814.1 hypothetical protein Aiant_04710 [Actinoplanes ianthinogenes]GGR08319.1 hypothetical protein GCM10010168_26740 [Actinoplanes ianthinogenes]
MNDDVAPLSFGDGPGLVVVPGNNRRAHHYTKLAELLQYDYRVTVIERRGRGASGPQARTTASNGRPTTSSR